MNKRNFEFYLEYGGNRIPVTPYYKTLSKKTAKEAGQQFYRESLEGQVKFVGDDFKLIYDEPITTEFTFIVMLDGADYYKGTFTKVDCKLDIAKQTVEPKFKTKDAYAELLDRYKDEYDLIGLNILTEPIACKKRPFTQIYCLGASSVTNVYNRRTWETDTSVAIETGADIKKYGFTSIGAFREIYIEGASIEGVNGIYNKFEYKTEDISTDLFIEYYLWYSPVRNGVTYAIQLARYNTQRIVGMSIFASNQDNPLYGIPQEDLDAHPGSLNQFFRERGDMTNLVFPAVAGSDFAIVTKDFLYDIYARVINAKSGTKINYNDFAISNTSYKFYTNAPTLTIKQSAASEKTETSYGVNDYGEYFTNKDLPSLNSPYDSYLPICRSSWVNTSIWLTYIDEDFRELDSDYSYSYTLRDSFNIGNVIKGLLTKVAPNITHDTTAEYSHFLHDDTFILPNMPEKFYPYITQKTNMIKGTYDQAAQTAKTSMEEIMNMLRDCFRCYWYVDSDNKLRIEHISYFLNGRSYEQNNASIDLTTVFDSFNRKRILLGQGAIEYDISDLSRKYTFSFVDESFLPFYKANLEFDAAYIDNSKIEDIAVNNFSADVDYMQIEADSVSSDGFALLCPVKINDELSLSLKDVQVVEKGRPNRIYVNNAYASWGALIGFYMWGAVSSKFEYTSLLYDISSSIQSLANIMKQSLSVPFMPNLRPYMKIITDIGEGQIESVSENLDTGYLSINLVYPM